MNANTGVRSLVAIRVWILMGTERRETVIEIPREEFESGVSWVAAEPGRSLEAWIEPYLWDWLYVQYGWGWSGAGFENDYSCMEGAHDGGYQGLSVTRDSSIPNTVRRQSEPIQRVFH